MSGFQLDEVVDVTIKGVRILGEDARGHVTIAVENGDAYPLPPQAAIERVAPAEWPPQPGDLWRDRDGTLWFAVEEKGHHPAGLMCDSSQVWNPSEVGANWSPLALAHREGGEQA